MVRRKQDFSETASLMLIGPRAIIPEVLYVDARLDRTWYELLTEELHLPITDTGIFLCSSKFTPSSPKEGEGWRSELTDKISDFVSKFKRGRKQYTVRLCHPNNISAYQEKSIHGEDARYGAHQSTSSLICNHDQIPGRGGNRVRAPTPGRAVSRGRKFPRINTPSSATPLPSTSSTSRSQSRGPAIVIPTQQGAVPITPRTRARSSQQNGSYERPRYVHEANGTPPTPNANHKYSTRLKRRFEESGMTNNMDNGAEEVPEVKQTRREAPSVIQRYQMQQQLLIEQKSEQSMETPGPSVLRIQDVRSVVKREVAEEEEQDEVEGDEEEEEEEEWSRNWNEEPEDPVVRRDRKANRNVGIVGNGAIAKDNDGLPQEIQMEEYDDDSSDNSASDNDSLCTAADAEENELRNSGIPVQPVKPVVENRLHTRFGNAFLLRIKAEIAELRHNNLWERNVKRAPLGCYFLTEIFRD